MQTPDKDPEDKIDEAAEKVNVAARDYAKYAGMAIKMGVIIALFVIGGQWLDNNRPLSTETPVYTVVLSLLGVGIALYSTLKELIGKQ